MLKKRKERKVFEKKFNPELILDYDKEFVLKNLKVLYPPGTIVDQTTAYEGLGAESIEIRGNSLEYAINEEGTNIAFGGVGIWHSAHKKLPKIISNVQKKRRE
jgi:hypothetical protein